MKETEKKQKLPGANGRYDKYKSLTFHISKCDLFVLPTFRNFKIETWTSCICHIYHLPRPVSFYYYYYCLLLGGMGGRRLARISYMISYMISCGI